MVVAASVPIGVGKRITIRFSGATEAFPILVAVIHWSTQGAGAASAPRRIFGIRPLGARFSRAWRISFTKPGESLLSVTVAHGQSFRVLPSLSAVSESGSHVTAAVSGSVYSATVAVSGVSEVGTPVHTLTHEGSEAHGVLSGLTLPNEPKPLGQHRPPPPRSILSPGESSYPP
nr:hypothetical protein [Tanacetum cinerariifolium]